jgi:hypothetical protein
MVGTSANNSDLDAVFRIPLFVPSDLRMKGNARLNTHPSIAIENVDIITSVQVINGTFTIDFESVWAWNMWSDDQPKQCITLYFTYVRPF